MSVYRTSDPLVVIQLYSIIYEVLVECLQDH